MRALALAFLPLAVQFKAPAATDPIPLGSSVCNPAETHCVVNYADWAEWQKLVEENNELRQMVKTVKCASVTVLEPTKTGKSL
jgi:hypothetical protein